MSVVLAFMLNSGTSRVVVLEKFKEREYAKVKAEGKSTGCHALGRTGV